MSMERLARLALCLLAAIVLSCSKDVLPEEPQPEEQKEQRREWSVVTEELHASRDGIDIYGVLLRPEGRAGRLPTIIFSHGLRGHYDDCLPYAEICARKGFACYCFDFIGGALANRSGGSYEEMSILTEIEDLEAVVEMILSKPFTDKEHLFLAGGSQGGLVTAMYAARYPAVPRGLVLLFPAFNIPSLAESLLGVMYGGDLSAVPEKVSVAGFSVYKKYVEDAVGWDPYKTIGNYKGKVMIMHGTKDLLVPLSYSERAANVYPSATLIKLEGQGHGFDEDGTVFAAEQALENLLFPLSE